MVQEELHSLFDESVEIRKHIQNDLGSSYSGLKKLVNIVTDIEGSTFKFLVDMYHYRNGGYPQPNSDPKHYDVMAKFANLVKYFTFLDMQAELDLIESLYGLKVEIMDPIQDFDIVGDKLETIKNQGFQATTFKEFLSEAILRGDTIQDEICVNADNIKEIAKELEEGTKIKPKHFTAAVMTECRRQAAAEEDNVVKAEKVEESINDEYTSYTNSLELLDVDVETETDNGDTLE